jgi:putative transposase
MPGGGFTHLCLWTDLFSRKIVGWQVEETMEETLVIRALGKALRSRQPGKGLILHADRICIGDFKKNNGIAASRIAASL